MSEPRWIDEWALLLLHDESIAEHGGATPVMLDVAADDLDEAGLAAWIGAHAQPRRA